MKKYLSIAMMAIMTLCCVSLVSCGDDKEETSNPSNLKVELLNETNFTASGQIDAVVKFLQDKVGTTGTISKVGAALQLNTTTANLEAFKTALKNITFIEMYNVLAAVNEDKAKTASIKIYTTSEVLLDYSYSIVNPVPTGTWTATINGKVYKLVVTDIPATDEKHFKATFYEDDLQIPGEIHAAGTNYNFFSDEEENQTYKYIVRLIPVSGTSDLLFSCSAFGISKQTLKKQ